MFGLLGTFLSQPGLGRYRGETEIKKSILGHPYVVDCSGDCRSPLEQWSSAPAMVLELENPELGLGKYFQFQLSQECFYLSLQVKELQGYLKLKIPLGFIFTYFSFL